MEVVCISDQCQAASRIQVVTSEELGYRVTKLYRRMAAGASRLSSSIIWDHNLYTKLLVGPPNPISYRLIPAASGTAEVHMRSLAPGHLQPVSIIERLQADPIVFVQRLIVHRNEL